MAGGGGGKNEMKRNQRKNLSLEVKEKVRAAYSTLHPVSTLKSCLSCGTRVHIT